MKSNLLSQEEIDQLLRAGAGGDDQSFAPGADGGRPDRVIAGEDLEQVRQCIAETIDSAASTLGVLLSGEVKISIAGCEEKTWAELREGRTGRVLLADVEMGGALTGTSRIVMSERMAIVIAGLMMGLDMNSLPEELNDLYASAVGEAVNQMLSSVATGISGKIKQRVDMMPPATRLVNWDGDEDWGEGGDSSFLCLSYNIEATGVLAEDFWHLLPPSAVSGLARGIRSVTQPSPTPKPTAASTGGVTAGTVAPATAAAAVAPTAPAAGVAVRPVQFGQLQPMTIPPGEGNMGLIMDVPMQVTVELGRTRKLVREILDLAPGAVMELDKLAGEPVDVLVNGKLIAKGEVVVIDENFAVKVTDIVGVLERAVKS
ncbi:MAG: flagellar motor switch phosphatase FliY [Negativicutes bacterium]|nr:flagellar motor switch phosphatase FliY [Negativicutes bacterium]